MGAAERPDGPVLDKGRRYGGIEKLQAYFVTMRGSRLMFDVSCLNEGSTAFSVWDTFGYWAYAYPSVARSSLVP